MMSLFTFHLRVRNAHLLIARAVPKQNECEPIHVAQQRPLTAQEASSTFDVCENERQWRPHLMRLAQPHLLRQHGTQAEMRENRRYANSRENKVRAAEQAPGHAVGIKGWVSGHVHAPAEPNVKMCRFLDLSYRVPCYTIEFCGSVCSIKCQLPLR